MPLCECVCECVWHMYIKYVLNQQQQIFKWKREKKPAKGDVVSARTAWDGKDHSNAGALFY